MVKIVAADGGVIHEHTVGGMSGSTPIAVASSTKWLTAATLMTFVDQGAIGLDDDIARWLPEFAGSDPPITARQLLSHTSGVHDNPCQNEGNALATCVMTLASSSREFAAGTPFLLRQCPVPRGRPARRGARQQRLRFRRPTAAHGSARHGRHDVAGRARRREPGVRGEHHRRRLREVPRHDPARRRGERGPGAVGRRGRADGLGPGVGLRHHARLLRRHHRDPPLRTRMLARRVRTRP